MKREIKFRGKPSKDEPFVYGNLCKGVFGDALIQVTNGNNFINNVVVIEETVGQYTGKKDCEGKEIYEGDIIEFDRREWGGDDNIHVVSWNEQDACWSWGGGNSGDMGWRKVIGNVYENPELLPK